MSKINLKAQSLLGYRLSDTETVRAGAKIVATAGTKNTGGSGGGVLWWLLGK